jgi:hypothetical protein
MRSGVKVFAWRAIRRGDEITIDYRLNAFSGEHSSCACGSVSCAGTITLDFFSLNEPTRRCYLPYAPQFVRHEYRARKSDSGAKSMPASLRGSDQPTRSASSSARRS